MRLAVVVFAAISLVACGRSPEAEFADTAPPQMFGQVRAAGTEPFWGLSVSPKEGFVLTEAGAPDPVRATYVEPEAIDGGGRFNARAFTLTVTQGTCSDGMSDIAYPLNARVVVGDRTLVGCAYYPWGANLTSLIPAIDACLAKAPARMPVTHGYLKDGFAYVRLSASGPEESYDCVYQAGEATVKRAEGQLPGERIPTFYRAPMDDPGESCAPHEEIKDSSGVLLGWSIADGAC